MRNLRIKRKLDLRSKNKLKVLSFINKNKDILFNKFISTVEKAIKWKEVHSEAVKLGVVHENKGWEYLRDSVWQEWKKNTLDKKHINDIYDLSLVDATTKIEEYDVCDKLILNILNTNTNPTAVELKKHAILQSNIDDDDDLEIIEDNNKSINILESESELETSDKNVRKLPQINFIPVQKKNLVPPQPTPKSIDNNNSLKKEDDSSYMVQLSSNGAITDDITHTSKKPRLNDYESNHLCTDVKSIQKSILDNVRDIKIKLMQRKTCQTCSEENKEILKIQKKLLDVQEKNLQIQTEILAELRKKNNKDKN